MPPFIGLVRAHLVSSILYGTACACFIGSFLVRNTDLIFFGVLAFLWFQFRLRILKTDGDAMPLDGFYGFIFGSCLVAVSFQHIGWMPWLWFVLGISVILYSIVCFALSLIGR